MAPANHPNWGVAVLRRSSQYSAIRMGLEQTGFSVSFREPR
jgi:hypothetical protein